MPTIFDCNENVHSWGDLKSNAILDMVDVHVSLVSRSLKVLWANEKARNLFGQDMVGKQCYDVYSSPAWLCNEQSECLIKKALFEDNIKEHEVKLTAEDGTEKSLLGRAQVVSRDKDGIPLTIAMIYKEITEHKLAKEELEESMQKLEKNLGDTIMAISRTVESRDPYTAGHQQRTMIIAKDIAKIMGLNKQQITGISMAGAVHDLGKICIPASILSKPGKINKTEFSLIKAHPETGYSILKHIDFNSPVAEAVLQHHERLDGSGYPFGLAGDAILLESRVVGVADVIEAIASPRPYRSALGIDTAIDEIKKNKGKLYDPLVVDAAIDLFSSNNNPLYHA
jgi:HD-GYP domain-containing protein (c-di-GMP phosphodiesterase class II)